MRLFRSLSQARPTRTRRPSTNRYTLVLEGLEQRTVLSHMGTMPPMVAADVAGIAKHADRLTISSVTVNNLVLNNANQLVANVTVSGTVKHQAFTILCNFTDT